MIKTPDEEHPQEGDAHLEIGEEELSKVSGGVGGLRKSGLRIRDDPTNGGLRAKRLR